MNTTHELPPGAALVGWMGVFMLFELLLVAIIVVLGG